MLNTKISNNLEPSVLALLAMSPQTEASLVGELKTESPYITDHDVVFATARLAEHGLIRQRADRRWELGGRDA